MADDDVQYVRNSRAISRKKSVLLFFRFFVVKSAIHVSIVKSLPK